MREACSSFFTDLLARHPGITLVKAHPLEKNSAVALFNSDTTDTAVDAFLQVLSSQSFVTRISKMNAEQLATRISNDQQLRQKREHQDRPRVSAARSLPAVASHNKFIG